MQQSPTEILLSLMVANLEAARSIILGSPPTMEKYNEICNQVVSDVAEICEKSNVTLHMSKDSYGQTILELKTGTAIWTRRKLLENTWFKCSEIMKDSQPIGSEFAAGYKLEDWDEQDWDEQDD